MSKISIIMGIYNCAETLPEAIDSILAQTYTNWELILCDDASTDNTYSIAAKYKDRYPEQIKLLQNEVNSKLSYTLNHCLTVAMGDYIARMDGDDISQPSRLEKQVSFLKTHPEFDLVGTGAILFDETGERAPILLKEFPEALDLTKGPCFAHATILARREVYDRLGGYKVSKMTVRAQDCELWFRFFHAGFKGYNLQEALYKVRDDQTAYKRRTFKARFNSERIRYQGYRLLKFPLKYYFLGFWSFFKIFVPTPIARAIRKKRWEKRQARREAEKKEA